MEIPRRAGMNELYTLCTLQIDNKRPTVSTRHSSEPAPLLNSSHKQLNLKAYSTKVTDLMTGGRI